MHFREEYMANFIYGPTNNMIGLLLIAFRASARLSGSDCAHGFDISPTDLSSLLVLPAIICGLTACITIITYCISMCEGNQDSQQFTKNMFRISSVGLFWSLSSLVYSTLHQASFRELNHDCRQVSM